MFDWFFGSIKDIQFLFLGSNWLYLLFPSKHHQTMSNNALKKTSRENVVLKPISLWRGDELAMAGEFLNYQLIRGWIPVTGLQLMSMWVQSTLLWFCLVDGSMLETELNIFTKGWLLCGVSKVSHGSRGKHYRKGAGVAFCTVAPIPAMIPRGTGNFCGSFSLPRLALNRSHLIMLTGFPFSEFFFIVFSRYLFQWFQTGFPCFSWDPVRWLVPPQEERLSITIFLGMPQLHGAIGEHVHTRGEQERRAPWMKMGI